MLLLKIIVFLGFLSVLYSLARTVWAARRSLEPGLPNHRRWATTTLCLALFSIVMTELFVRFNGGVQDKQFVIFHLSLAVPFFLSLLTLRFFMTGIKDPFIHRILAYSCLGFFLGTFVTGIVLLWYA